MRWYADERACPALPGLPPIFFSYDQNDFRGDSISLNFPPLNAIAENPACQRFAFPSSSNVFGASGVLGETQDTGGGNPGEVASGQLLLFLRTLRVWHPKEVSAGLVHN